MHNREGQNKTPKHLSLVLITLIIATQFIPHAHAARTTLTGTITDTQGNPIQNAEITVLTRRYIRHWSRSWNSYTSTTTNTNGEYSLNLETDSNYLILVSHTQNDEYDYVPYGWFISPTDEAYTENITLWTTSIIKFDGLAYFIETTAIPDTTFKVLEPNSTEIIRYGDMGLSYGTTSSTITLQLGIPSNKVYVPSNQNFKIQLQSYASSRGETVHREITIQDYIEETLEPGETVTIDLRSLILPESIETIQTQTAEVDSIIVEKEEQGFFLAVERHQLGDVQQTIDTATSLLSQGNFEEAFTKSREAFVLLSDLENGLNNLLSDASRSVYILLGFICATSIVVASLLYENSLHKALFSTGFYTLLLIIFYYLHPGAQITDKIELVKISVISLLVVNTAAWILPKLMNRGSTGRDISLTNMMVPIFSIAKRSLRRRRLRFLLTLTSVLLLVASFISLTSFTSGYGLSFTKTGNTIQKEGIMIRTPDPPPSRALAPFSGGTGAAGPLPLDESILEWYRIIEEVMDIVPRYENYAQRQYRELYKPVAYIERTQIFGMVGIDPFYEAEVNQLDTAIIEGRYLGDAPGEVLISAKLAEALQKTIGDHLTITSQEKTHELTIVGILDDKTLEDLTDIDGYSIMPQKIIELERIEADGPDFVTEGLAPCTAEETLWVNLETGKNLSALWLLRVNLVLKDEVDILEFAQSTALNRGFRAWASTHTGIYLAELTDYFEGKGLPIVIPWVIVTLNVVVTMMNAYYERRHEVMIYSSIGMNPRHISSIFLAEAAVIGIVGGCLGYLVGLGAYKIIYILTPALQVKQKVSAFWSLAAIGISLMAVLVGGLSALKNSTSITPSLRRRWMIDEEQKSSDETRIVMPIQVYEEEIDDYIRFLWSKLEAAKKSRTMAVRIPQMKQFDEKSWEYTFIYSSANPQISPLYTRNRLKVEKLEGKTYTTILYTRGDADSVKQAGSFLRQIGLDWSLEREGDDH